LTSGRGESLQDAAAGSAAKAMIVNKANIVRFITPPDPARRVTLMNVPMQPYPNEQAAVWP
jgi:hypothetical protein